MRATPRLSVCIPTYNMAQWVGTAVESALALGRLEEIEIVIVDNCSTDDTSRILSTFDAAPNVTVISATTHVGMADNWNRAVRASNGNWVTLLSADDELLPSYYENLRPRVEQDGAAAFSQVARMIAGDSEQSFGPIVPTTYELSELVASLGFAACITTTAFRRDLYDKIGGFDATVGPLLDFDLLTRMVATSGLPLRALGVEGGTYFADHGGTWARHEASGESEELLQTWIDERCVAFGDTATQRARDALGDRSRHAARKHLFAENAPAARRSLAVAIACTHGRSRVESRLLSAAVRVSPALARAVLAVYLRRSRRDLATEFRGSA